MPELPEVEVSRLGITPHLTNRTIRHIDVRQPMLRWPVPAEVMAVANAPVLNVSRRAKYLLIEVSGGSIILHLGMSGNLKILSADTPAGKHDHVDIVLDNKTLLRLNDTRRFGAVLWQPTGIDHPLLTTLGPEPLTPAFHAEQLFVQCQKRSSAIKLVLMDNHVVVGVGNIYANESLFKAGILPTKPANQLTLAQCAVLVEVVKQILAQAITQGGTTLKDFSQADGKPGYFKQELLVYGRGGDACVSCNSPLEEIRLGQRSTVFCRHCQA
ncbi:bifunctional DNA-formamidopyrimidine glycosylase/DNA-(apurinic or apyrimidinic site) lyase [Rheinheimera sp.]|uniref:bifunctional DNA-formamidopyrimidine glycosylase/DNA-(apurinic or apyrimidinic site) lyase n=1 Tax=Rheinheimera sp. TaxID=1869214 RepID=UPI003D293B31